MIKVKLYQKKTKLRADGKAPLYYLLSEGKRQKLISTHRYLEPNYFDNVSGLVLRGCGNATALNSFFRSQLTELDNIIMDLSRMGQETTFEKVEQLFNNNYGDDFIAFAFDELEQNQKGVISFKTYQGYKTCLNNLKSYRAQLPFNALTHGFLTEYRHYLVTVRKRKKNGYYQDFATIKKFHKIAQLKGEVIGNPFANFKLGREETNKYWLTENELGRLHDLLNRDSLTFSEIKLSEDERKLIGAENKITEGQKNSLRHFLFCCYTGLRFGDKKNLSLSEILEDRLTIKTSKTNKNIVVPLNPQAKTLLTDVLNRKLKQRNKLVNYDLEAAMKAAGISKHITFHCSRHTFAVNCIILGIDIITVRDWLGHSSVTTTEIYAKMAQAHKDESMKKWENFGKLRVA